MTSIPAAGVAGRAAIVTDSTCYLPAELVAQTDVVVPMHVIMDGRSFREGVDITPARVAQALGEGKTVGTSRIGPATFLEVYRSLAEAGATGVLSVHLSAGLSGTVEAAEQAAADSPIPVGVVDSESVAMGMGYAVVDAAAAARRGVTDLTVLAGIARETAGATRLMFYLDSLEQLRRGGRLGAASALVGQALRVKPILHLEEGRVAMLDKVRTAGKALQRLVELAVLEAQQWPTARIAVQHLDAADRADAVEEALRAALPGAAILRSEIGAVIGAHTGRGTVAVTVAPPAATPS